MASMNFTRSKTVLLKWKYYVAIRHGWRKYKLTPHIEWSRWKGNMDDTSEKCLDGRREKCEPSLQTFDLFNQVKNFRWVTEKEFLNKWYECEDYFKMARQRRKVNNIAAERSNILIQHRSPHQARHFHLTRATSNVSLLGVFIQHKAW